MTMTTLSPDAQVLELLARCAGCGKQLVGVEVELGVLRQADLAPATYDGQPGIRALLQAILDEGGFRPVHEGVHLIELAAESGETLTLEPGGQVEISTAATADLAAQGETLRQAMRRLARAAEDLGLVVIAGGLMPVGARDAPWMPKQRYRIMREWFAGLGEPGRLAHSMMQRTQSTQVSLDYTTAEDCADLLRLALLAAPAATAVFASTPFDGLTETEFSSFRAEIWRFTDPSRQGDIPASTFPGVTLAPYVEHALAAPMMFRIKDGTYLPMRGASFREVLAQGRWPDGDPVTERDIWNHLNSIFTNARIKCGLIELRSTDGQHPDEAMTVPAFWLGLLYDDVSRAGARELLGQHDLEAHTRALELVPRLGLRTPLGGRTLLEVGRELVELARAGIARRAQAGREDPRSVALLDPVRARLAQGLTLADELRALWRGPWQRDPSRLVEHLRVKPD